MDRMMKKNEILVLGFDLRNFDSNVSNFVLFGLKLRHLMVLMKGKFGNELRKNKIAFVVRKRLMQVN